MTDPILAWHFLPKTRMLRDGSMRVEAGYTYTYHGTPVLCRQGLHASVRAIDALRFAPGPIVCRVECGGMIVHGDDKLACTERTVLWMADASITLHEFACDVAEQALRRASVDDARCWAAIEAKRKWLAGEITDANMDAAWAEASATASATASAAAKVEPWNAAWAEARAAAKVEAWNAAKAAAWAEASAAAKAAAWAEASAAAWATARGKAAAWAAAWDAHNDMLTARMEALDHD